MMTSMIARLFSPDPLWLLADVCLSLCWTLILSENDLTLTKTKVLRLNDIELRKNHQKGTQ